MEFLEFQDKVVKVVLVDHQALKEFLVFQAKVEFREFLEFQVQVE